MNAVEKFNKTLGAIEYNDREEALYSIFRNIKKAVAFQKKAPGNRKTSLLPEW